MKIYLQLFFSFILLTCSLKISGQSSLSIEQKYPEAAILLSNYIQFASTSGNEIPAGDYLHGICLKKQLHTKKFNDEKGAYNFCASLYPLESGKPNIILLNHIDVVQAGDIASWNFPPYSGKITEQTIWGRGAIDAKGLAIMQLMALKEFVALASDKDLPYNVTLLSVSDEENGGKNGANKVINDHFTLLNPVLVLGEGGSGILGTFSDQPQIPLFGISIAEKKRLWIKLRIKNFDSGHGSVPPKQYANKSMIQALSRLADFSNDIHPCLITCAAFKDLSKYEKGIKKMVLAHLNKKPFLWLAKKNLEKEAYINALFKNTFVISKIENQECDHNQIAESATAYLDCRLLPGYDNHKFIQDLIKCIANPNVEIEIVGESLDAPVSAKGKFYQILKKSIEDNYPNAIVLPVLFPATTDNTYFRKKNIDTYGIIPSILSKKEIECVHGPNEHIQIETLLKGISTYTHFLSKVLEINKFQQTDSDSN